MPTDEVPQRHWLRRLLPVYARPRRVAVLAVLASLSASLLVNVFPVVVQRTVDDSLLAADGSLGSNLRLLVAIALVALAFDIHARIHFMKLGVRLDFALRTRVQAHLARMSFSFHDRADTGQLISRANADIHAIEMFLTIIPLFGSLFLGFGLAVVLMLRADPVLAAIILATLPAVAVAGRRMTRRTFPLAYLVQSRTADLATLVEENLSGAHVVRATAAEAEQIADLEVAADRLRWATLREIGVRARFGPLIEALPRVGQAVFVLVAGLGAIRGRVTIGEVVLFTSYLAILTLPFRVLGPVVTLGQRARAASGRLFEIIDDEPEIVDRPDAVPLRDVAGEIAFDGVEFGYGEDPILRGFDLRLATGEKVALVGRTASGKSTAASLLPRFYDVTDGRVTIDGQDVRDVTLASLRANVGVVMDDNILFTASIRENVGFARPDAPFAVLREAARAAGALDFIEALADGWDTVVGERGQTLSGGQRQRIALARTIVQDPAVLILDDATSAIDVAVERAIHDALEHLFADRTMLLIAHRPATIALADRVALLADGRVVATGTHVDLLAREPRYAETLALLESSRAEEQTEPEPAPSSPPATTDTGASGAPAELAGPLARLLAEEPAHTATPKPLQRHVDDRRPFSLRQLVAPARGIVALAVVLVGLETAAAQIGPLLIQRAVDLGIGEERADVVAWSAGLLLGAALLSYGLGRGRIMLTGRIGQDLSKNLRVRVFEHLQRLSHGFFSQERVGRLLTRMTSDIDALGQLLQDGIVNLIVQVFTLLVVTTVMFSLDVQLASVVLLTVVPAMTFLTLWFRRRSGHAYGVVRERIAELLADLQENIVGARVIAATNRIDRNHEDHRDLAAQHRDARIRAGTVGGIFSPTADAVGRAGQVVVLLVGGRLVLAGSLQPGELIAFVLYLGAFFAPIQQLTQLYNSYQAGQAAVDRIADLLAEEPTVTESATAAPLRLDRGAVVLESVRFGYQPDVPVLDGVDLAIDPGETIAVVGTTGAGKSTLAKLLTRAWDPWSGRVLVDGTDVRDVQLTSLRAAIGVVPQEPFLFSGSLRRNLVLGREGIDDETITVVCRRLGLGPLLDRLGSLDARIAARGVGLSAGERQLLSMARALLPGPRLLVLDEATSNLDLASERLVERALDTALEGCTAILIAHRLSTAERADRVVVMDRGRIVEAGPHDQLVDAGGKYSEMFRGWQVANAA